MTLFAFYGTLMSGDRRHQLLEDLGTHEGPCVIPGLLFDVGAFPALLPEITFDGTAYSAFVVGELWRPYSARLGEAIRVLDRIEGENGTPWALYRRVRQRLASPDVDAWVYHWNDTWRGLALVPSGDWREHANRKQEARSG